MVDSVTYYDFPLPDVKKVNAAEKLLHEDNKTRYVNLKSIINYIEEEGDISVIEKEFIKNLQNGFQLQGVASVNEFIDKNVPISALSSVFQTYTSQSGSEISISHPGEIEVERRERDVEVIDDFTETLPAEAFDDWAKYMDVETQTDKLPKSTQKLEVCFRADILQENVIPIKQIDTKMTLIEKAVKTVAYGRKCPSQISKDCLVKQVMKVISSKSQNKPEGSEIKCNKMDSKMLTIEEAMKIYEKIEKSAVKKHYRKEKIQREKTEKAEELGYLADYVSDEDYFYSDTDSEFDSQHN